MARNGFRLLLVTAIATLCVGYCQAQRIASLDRGWDARTYQPGAISSAVLGTTTPDFDPYQTSSTQLAQAPPHTLLPYESGPLPLQPIPMMVGSSMWQWKMLPKDTIYPFYLADEKASRMAGRWTQPEDDNMLIDATLGGRVGIFRFGDSNRGPYRHGIQLDVEGSAQLRLDLEENVDVRSVDFRAGIPLSFGFGRWHARFGYYHLSSHVGDEFLLKNPDFTRLNYARDVLFLGAGYWITERVRVYGEAGWAFYTDISEEWEFSAGVEYVPTYATGARGAPYAALHGQSREELNFGGSVTAQAGWAWRGVDGGLLRLGLHYHEGKSWQWSFFNDNEPLIGIGLWYDY